MFFRILPLLSPQGPRGYHPVAPGWENPAGKRSANGLFAIFAPQSIRNAKDHEYFQAIALTRVLLIPKLFIPLDGMSQPAKE